MSRANPHATIVPEEQLVPRANRLVIKKNNQRVISDSTITDTMLRFVIGILRNQKLYKLVSLTATVPMIYLHQNKNIPRRSNSEMHSEGDGLPITKLSNTIEAKAAKEPKEHNVPHVISGRGKGYMRSGENEANVPKLFKKNVVPRKTRSLIVAEETVAAELAKSASIKEPYTQQRSKASKLESLKQKKQPVAGYGSSVSHTKYYDNSETDNNAILYSSYSNTLEESANETDDADESYMDDDVAGSSKSSPPANTTCLPIKTLQPSSLQAKAKKLMQKAKKNMRKINFKKAVAQKFRDYDQKLEALTNFNVSEAFEKAVQARISLFTKSSTFVDDLSDMDLKLKMLNKIHENKTRPTNQKLYDNLYESILLDQDALDAQEASPNNREGEKKKKRQKDVGQPSTQTSRKDKAPMVQAQKDTHADQPQDQAGILIQHHSNPGWFTKKSGLANAMRRTKWFDLLLKSNINQNEDHILGPSTVAIAKNLKEIIQKDELTIANLEGVGLEKLKLHYKNDVELEYHVDQFKAAVVSEAQWNSDEGDVSKPRSFECHMSKSSKPYPRFYNNDLYYLVDLSTKEKYTTSLTKHYAARYHIQGIEDMASYVWSKYVHHYLIKALNGIHHWEDEKQDFFKAEINNRTPGNVYSDKKIISLVKVIVKRKWGYGFLSSIVNDKDNKKSKEMVNKIDQVMKRKEQLHRLEEYVGGRPKTINPRVFVRPMHGYAVSSFMDTAYWSSE
ncbi:hypothetical protein Tco_1570154 [Tanacetum coccineum]